MYKRWPKTVPEGLKMELRGKKDRRHVRTHRREEKSRVRLWPSVGLTPEKGGMFGNASLGQGSGNERVLNRGGAVCTCDGFSRKKRNFAKRLRCPQLFKSTLSKWNGMERRLLLNGKKMEFLFSKRIDLDGCAPSGKGKVAGMRRGSGGGTLSCGHLSSHKKWTQFHLLFKIEDVFL